MKKITLTAALLAASFLPSAAQAKDSGFYVGVGYQYKENATLNGGVKEVMEVISEVQITDEINKKFADSGSTMFLNYIPKYHMLTIDLGRQLADVISIGAKLGTECSW